LTKKKERKVRVTIHYFQRILARHKKILPLLALEGWLSAIVPSPSLKPAGCESYSTDFSFPGKDS
jgi:hypothetical protein